MILFRTKRKAKNTPTISDLSERTKLAFPQEIKQNRLKSHASLGGITFKEYTGTPLLEMAPHAFFTANEPLCGALD